MTKKNSFKAVSYLKVFKYIDTSKFSDQLDLRNRNIYGLSKRNEYPDAGNQMDTF